MTAQLFRELLESLDDDIETLGMEEVVTEGEDNPNQTIARVKKATETKSTLIREELKALKQT